MISTFRQKNKLQVTKSGVKGASATVVIANQWCCMSIPVILYAIFNKPFTYSVLYKLDKKNYLPIFSGQVTDPVAPIGED